MFTTDRLTHQRHQHRVNLGQELCFKQFISNKKTHFYIDIGVDWLAWELQHLVLKAGVREMDIGPVPNRAVGVAI